MSLSNRFFVIRITVTAAFSLVSAAFAQSSDAASTDNSSDIQRTADLVNLMRTVLDPNPAPVLTSLEKRAVSTKTSADPASSVATTIPVVIMPDIKAPEEESGEPDTHETAAQELAQSAAVPSAKKDADEADSEDYPPFYYVFFFGEYVPYFEGWYYYSGRWIRDRQWSAPPPEPSGWIPPPPRSRLPDPVRPKEPDNTIPVVPDRHRIPRKSETRSKPLPIDSGIPVAPSRLSIPSNSARRNSAPQSNSTIPVAPSQHRIPRGNR